MQRTSRIIAVALFAALAGSIAEAQTPMPAAAAGIPNPSGFLPDYARLQPVPGKDGRYAWLAPDAQLKQYTKFILPPMEIWIDKDAQVRGLAADVVQRIASIYQSSFKRVLAPQFIVVTKPGAGVATCKFALTGVTPERPGFTPLDVVPVKAAFNLVRRATGTSAQVARISAEISCIDSVSKALLLEAVITGVGTKRFVEGDPITWPEVSPVLSEWAQDFKARLLATR